MICKICSEEILGADHDVSQKHLKNKALYEYSLERKKCAGNRKGAVVTCNVKSSYSAIIDNADSKIKISAKPDEEIKFQFTIYNESKKEDLSLTLIKIPTNKLNFVMNNHGITSDSKPECLKPKQKLKKDVYVTFKSADIGQYQMPIVFLFSKKETKETFLIIRDMEVFIETKQTKHQKMLSPFNNKDVMADVLIKTEQKSNSDSTMFRIPPNYKRIYASALKVREGDPEETKELVADISNVYSTGATKENYIRFFHNLLWHEETIVRINLKKYNMSEVPLKNGVQGMYWLEVPGLAEKRPSLLAGDLLFIKPSNTDKVMFEGIIGQTENNTISIKGLDPRFEQYYKSTAKFDIRFFLSRMILERMHSAVDSVFRSGHERRIFPVKNEKITKIVHITEFFNCDVAHNVEQRVAVERAVSAGGGPAPFLLHGPPGTGKTVTLVEVALQLVKKDPNNKLLICTDSNMAADHVACTLIKYADKFPDNLVLRANSKYRAWETLPECLYEYSNGSGASTYEYVSNEDFLSHRIIITTLIHSAKFVRQMKGKRPITHLLIDEAGQASEPASLVPTGLLQANGRLLLAGDPLQLGPCVISHFVKRSGLGLSLMERLMKMEMYQSNDPDYTVMLRNNFRSSEDIIALPNELFYKNQLRACAEQDPLTLMCVLGERDHCRGVVFHGVLSREQRVGKSPSYFNNMEMEMVQKYVIALITTHRVAQQAIGIVTPYIRQVYKIKAWLVARGYERVEVGTVESFQGKEKRVVIISCVRAQNQLLAHDARYQLGFLVDDKRFNVALTRAKAKTIVIGNPLVLQRDEKWRRYIDHCRQLGTHYGFDAQEQAPVNDDLVGMMINLNVNKG